ncbi:hypothetical protein [Nocardioides sp. TF02-7]|uniref:hypothetical protein n=1 Tax=Nocardioides sp. TF02-7 TaxID=2917724 RepID=UPI001F053CED|nr:hypothetical protein [Nocardioides sp. TF02-7]UMG91872.1 hypothetical protein MF408_17815 [Nocardioides sp. TF02-7]
MSGTERIARDHPVGRSSEATRAVPVAGLFALAGLLVGNTLAGPLGIGVIDYPLTPTMLNQLTGLEVVTVVLVAPALVVAGLLALAGRSAAPLIAFGPCSYAAYMFVQYVLGPEYDHYSFAVLVHLAIAVLAGVLAIWCWTTAASLVLPPSSPARRRQRAGWLGFLAVFVLLRYTGALTGAVDGTAIPAEFGADRTFYWSIVLLDLGVVVPATVAAALLQLRSGRLASQAYYAVVGWFALVPPSVAAMAVVMLARDDLHASAATVALLSAASVVFAVPAVLAVRDLRA